MPIIVYRDYVAKRSGTALKKVNCEKCGQEFAYEIQRTVEGHGSSPFFLANEKAKQDAAKRADAHLEAALQSGDELVECPHCGWCQSAGVAVLLYRRFRWLRLAAWIALLGGSFFALMLHVMLSNQGRKPNYSGKPGLIAFEVLMIAIWFGCLRLRRRLARRYDPNVSKAETTSS